MTKKEWHLNISKLHMERWEKSLNKGDEDLVKHHLELAKYHFSEYKKQP